MRRRRPQSGFGLEGCVGATNLALYLDSSGYARIVCDGKAGLVDGECKFVLPCRYEDVKDVREGHFRAQVGGKWGVFALDGTCTLPAEYDRILSDDECGCGDP